MEERIIDRETERAIRLGRNAEGETDAADALAEDAEVLLEFPEEEYDESLVGLTPSQLEREMERRRKAEEEAREECAKLTEAGEEALSRGAFGEAESYFSQAVMYVYAEPRVMEGLWRARTREFTSDEAFYNRDYAEEFDECEEQTKAFVRARMGGHLREEREELAREEAEIAPGVEERQRTRAEAFAANRKYYLVRFAASLAAIVLCLVGVAVSANFIVRTRSVAPVALTVAFGVLAFAALCVMFVFARKLYLASRLCGENGKLSSTEEGARLDYLRGRLYCLNRFLGDGRGE